MHTKLIQELEFYQAGLEERHFAAEMISLLGKKENCFYRTCFEPGHITGSALLTDYDGSRVLLNRHKFLDKWLAFGGHADGDKNIRNVALRETMEESGFEDIEFVVPEIFDLDIHGIPENLKKKEPAHLHFDISFLLRLKKGVSPEFRISNESEELKWCDASEAPRLVEGNPNMARLIRKWERLKKERIAA